jgi:hypothetical protein
MNLPPPSGHAAFPPHGRSDFHADGAIIRVSVEGPFNVEGVDEFARKMLALYSTIPLDQPVVTLAELRRSVLMPPDAWARLEAHMQRARLGPPRVLATAWLVGPDVEGGSLMIPRARQMYADAGRAFEVFADPDAAILWAREQLAQRA